MIATFIILSPIILIILILIIKGFVTIGKIRDNAHYDLIGNPQPLDTWNDSWAVQGYNDTPLYTWDGEKWIKEDNGVKE